MIYVLDIYDLTLLLILLSILWLLIQVQVGIQFQEWRSKKTVNYDLTTKPRFNVISNTTLTRNLNE